MEKLGEEESAAAAATNAYQDNTYPFNISGDLDNCEIRPSLIPGAGLGLFAKRFIKKGSRATKYSGKVLTKAETVGSKSQYLLQVNKSKFLDAAGLGHMAGRRINEGTISGIRNNVRFGASLRSYECKKTGRQYKSVFALRDIHPDEELLAFYGWKVTWTYPAPQDVNDTGGESDDDETAEGPDEKAEGPEKNEADGPSANLADSGANLAESTRGSGSNPTKSTNSTNSTSTKGPDFNTDTAKESDAKEAPDDNIDTTGHAGSGTSDGTNADIETDIETDDNAKQATGDRTNEQIAKDLQNAWILEMQRPKEEVGHPASDGASALTTCRRLV